MQFNGGVEVKPLKDARGSRKINNDECGENSSQDSREIL
jgi:hypothetical protein